MTAGARIQGDGDDARLTRETERELLSGDSGINTHMTSACRGLQKADDDDDDMKNQFDRVSQVKIHMDNGDRRSYNGSAQRCASSCSCKLRASEALDSIVTVNSCRYGSIQRTNVRLLWKLIKNYYVSPLPFLCSHQRLNM
ncbi:hypothetical protein KP509_24G052200 [Ceratopteris richardii]|uniref:Uncharacterized protein n=1 Tax=Ceratopteris richardii TaxID=49495 RepID=A0A8T2RXU6_CERRI|nr:hypothetical protein KP509_24G052200 [Ceratopteris richardii]